MPVFRLLALMMALVAGLPAPGAEVEVDLELILAADVSGSMDIATGRLQRDGYVLALRSPEVQAAITSGPAGRIAIAYFEWGDSGLIDVVVPWTLVGSQAEAEAVAQLMETRRIGRFTKTSISHALGFAVRLFDGNGFDGPRRVIDISGNGPNNQGPAVDAARDAAVAAGITINGLPILTDLSEPRGIWGNGFDRRELDRYFADCVVGGPGAFVLAASGYESFAEAIQRKLLLEVSALPPAPEPERIFRVVEPRAAGRMPC